MDRVRFGRVLGRGARLAARTAYEALDAATAPASASSQQSPPPRTATASNTGHATILVPPQRSRVASRAPTLHVGEPRDVDAPRARAGRFAPLRRASRAVSLEVTGSFFALFAVSFAVGTWHARADLHAGVPGVARFSVYAGVSLFFAYCSVSNFRRAKNLK